MFRYLGLASYMLPIDFCVIMDVTGTDASKVTSCAEQQNAHPRD